MLDATCLKRNDSRNRQSEFAIELQVVISETAPKIANWFTWRRLKLTDKLRTYWFLYF